MKKTILRYVLLILGAVTAAFALEEFLVPCNILDGGVVGVSIIVSSLTKLPLSILTICLNIPFIIVGGRKLGSQFWLRTGVSMSVFSCFLEVFRHWHYNATYDALLATVFGGVILGAGVGLIIRNGGCLDGTETVAILLSNKLSMSVGQIVLIFNIIIYLTAGFLFGLDRALYSLLTYFIVSKVVDYITVGLDQAKAVMIITNEGRQIADDIYETLGRTVTFMEGEGLISGEKTVLYCVITRIELQTLRKIIENDDYSAFMTVSDVSEIVGRHIKSNDKHREQKS
jgi:uncharacterized membrane-anchored protein YitT (DUF2179 family)